MKPSGESRQVAVARLLARVAREAATGSLRPAGAGDAAGVLHFARGVLCAVTGAPVTEGTPPTRDAARRVLSLGGPTGPPPTFTAGAARAAEPPAGPAAVTAGDLAMDAARLIADVSFIRDLVMNDLVRPLAATKGATACPPVDPSPAARFVIARADGTVPIARLVSESPAGEAETLRMIFVLRAMGLVAPVEAAARTQDLDRFLSQTAAVGNTAPEARPGPAGARDPSQPGPPAAPPHPAWSAEEMKERAALITRCRAVGTRDFYAVLEVDPGATEQAIRASYYRLARLYHPDKLRKPHLLDIHRDLEAMFAGITEAYNTLCSAPKRREYDRQAREIAAGRRKDKPDGATSAREIFLKGRRMMDDGRTFEAISLFEAALQHDSSRAEYHLHLGICQGQNPRWRKKAEESLLKAISLNPSSHQGYLELARVYRKGGLERRALEMYAQVLKWAPEEEEALAALGGGPGGNEGGSSGGILRSIFGKD